MLGLLGLRAKQGAEAVAALLFTAMFGAFLLQVFTRYVLNAPLSWTLEFCLIAYLWTTFWCCAFLLRERDHIAFNLVYDSVPPHARRLLAMFGSGLLAVVFLAGLPGTFDFITFMAIDRTWVLQIRFDLVYSIFLVFMIAVILRSLWRLKILAGPDWRSEI